MKVEVIPADLIRCLRAGLADLDSGTLDLAEHGDRMYAMGCRHAVGRVAGMLCEYLFEGRPHVALAVYQDVTCMLDAAREEEQPPEPARKDPEVRTA